MSGAGVRRDILTFAYAERLKAALLTTGRLLQVTARLSGEKRQGALEMLSAYTGAVTAEMRLAANVTGAGQWRGLDTQFELVEGNVRLQHLEAAQQELARVLSRVTTVGARAMTSLQEGGFL